MRNIAGNRVFNMILLFTIIGGVYCPVDTGTILF